MTTKLSSLTRQIRVAPKTRPNLDDARAGRTLGLTREKVDAAKPAVEEELADLQELLYAAGTHALLVILQGMDTSGKDGTIKNVMDPVNPVGVHVNSFKVPTEIERGHDFLWRVHKVAPALGMIGIFNRSHYEDVLVVRVRNLAPKAVWSKRFRHMIEFERALAESNTIVLKFFLHISKKEQEERLLAREEEVEKAWKLSAGDWRERELWDDYKAAYVDAIARTSTTWAPWHVVPADKKWSRNHIVSTAIVDALRPFKAGWLASLEARGKAAMAELGAYREKQAGA
jgi:PPK2 family polyphosphate:nucleotide phosphotransferase